MTKFIQNHAEVRAAVDNAADDPWELLNDWVGFDRWRVKTEDDRRRQSNSKSLDLVDVTANITRSKVDLEAADKSRRR